MYSKVIIEIPFTEIDSNYHALYVPIKEGLTCFENVDPQFPLFCLSFLKSDSDLKSQNLLSILKQVCGCTFYLKSAIFSILLQIEDRIFSKYRVEGLY